MIDLNQDEIQLFIGILKSTSVQCERDQLVKMLELIIKLETATEEEDARNTEDGRT